MLCFLAWSVLVASYSVFLHAIFHPTSFTKRRRDSRVSTSASYVPSPGEFQPMARPEFMKPLEFIMILQVADYWLASGHPSAFKKILDSRMTQAISNYFR